MEQRIPYNKKDLVVRVTHKGQSVFANRTFRKNEFIIEFVGEIFTVDQYIQSVTPQNNHFLQIDTNLFQGPSDTPDNYINHSCNPNCGFRYQGIRPLLYSIRDIDKGEEITFDYSTTMDESFWEMECLCGDENCRGTIRDFRHLPISLQNKYYSLEIVPDFILQNMPR